MTNIRNYNFQNHATQRNYHKMSAPPPNSDRNPIKARFEANAHAYAQSYVDSLPQDIVIFNNPPEQPKPNKAMNFFKGTMNTMQALSTIGKFFGDD